MDYYNVPALSIAVAIDGELVWAKAYGELTKGSGKKVDTNTLFQAASLSKPIASIAALQLVGRQKVDLDKPVNSFLKSWQVPNNQFTTKKPVTLRHLLSHRSGASIHGFRGYKPSDRIPSLTEILNGEPPANTDKVTIGHIPGTQYKYSGGGFQVVQLLIEDLEETSYEQFVDESIFSPLNLTRSNFDYPQRDSNAAVGHVGADSKPIPGQGFFYPELAAAGLWSTPSELVTIGANLARDRKGANSLLPKHLVNQLIPESESEAGLGFGLNNDGDGVAFVHNGHNPGFSARWINYADGRASVAILTNSDSGGQLIREVLSALGEIYGWKQDAYVAKETVALDPEWTAQLTGQYFFDDSDTKPAATIFTEEGKLWLEGALTKKTRLYPTSETAFFISSGLNLKLIKNESGAPTALDIEGELTLTKK